MAKNDYRAVLRDLKERRAKLDAAIEVMEGILGVGKEKTAPEPVAQTAQAPIPTPTAPAPVSITNPAPAAVNTNGHQQISMVDACYNILKEAGMPLHAKVIAERVNAKYGKNVHYNSIAASLPQSAGNRFENTGGNIFQLTEWPVVEPEE
jgi:hypothetical protein